MPAFNQSAANIYSDPRTRATISISTRYPNPSWLTATALRADYGPGRPGSRVFRGPEAVTSQARPVPGAVITPILVNGSAGVIITLNGRPLAVMGFTIVDRRIVEIDAIADPDRVGDLAAALHP
jgi:hypothetical protein